MGITLNQELHRAYLGSPIWKAKRQQALKHYGCICRRCGEHGTDVHHKTYERVGGSELMEDLEILCRSCHDAHHRVERATSCSGSNRRKRSINTIALARYLTPTHREILLREFPMRWGLMYAAICDNANPAITKRALELIGKPNCHVGRRSHYKRQSMTESAKRHYSKLMA